MLQSGGNNVLAIRAINSGSSSSDMLLSAVLLLVELQPGPPAPIYVTTDGSDPRGLDGQPTVPLFDGSPITVSETTRIQARTLLNGQWSPLASELFTVPNPLRITEVMYQPREASGTESFSNRDEYEFIEVQNTSTTQTLDLAGYQIGGGVTFTFDTLLLGPGERAVAVNNIVAFRERYGDAIDVAGEYGGNLSNGGEPLSLLDAAGGEIVSFSYDDAWYPETDGDGYALVVVDPADINADLSAAAAWRASLAIDGSPGSSDRIAGDVNGDSRVDLLDLSVIQARIGMTSGALWTDGDLTGDGAVTRADVAVLARNFGKVAVANPPSPAASAIVAGPSREPAIDDTPRPVAPRVAAIRSDAARRSIARNMGVLSANETTVGDSLRSTSLTARATRARTVAVRAIAADRAIAAYLGE
jgi:hypothetical protein